MNSPAILQRHRSLRWLAPAGVVGLAALAATGMFKAKATSEALPETTPTSLIAAVQTAHTSGFSGTVVSSLSLGLPELPSLGGTGAGAKLSLTSLMAGAHTMQVWYGGADKQRVALFGATDETDLIHNGRSVWEWNSADRSAVHTVLSAKAASRLGPLVAPSPTSAAAATATATPPDVARTLLAALAPTTRVQVGGHTTQVADRSAYELLLTPRTTTTLVGSIRIFVDGSTKVPLGVQVYPRGADDPAIDISFTSIRFAQPADRNFAFAPPPDAKVHTVRPHHASGAGSGSGGGSAAAPAGLAKRLGPVKIIGTGWTRILAAHPPARTLKTIDRSLVGKAMTTVAGTWGSGRLLTTALADVLVTDDGRVFAGAVEPSALFAAAGPK